MKTKKNVDWKRRLLLLSPSAVITTVLLLAYAALATDQLFIPIALQNQLAFNLFAQPQNALFFMFVHVGTAHLAANTAVIFFFGRIVESKLSSRHVLGLFAGIGMISFALLNVANPLLFGLGASGGAVALLTTAVLLSPVQSLRALAAVVVVLLAGLLVVAAFQNWQDTQLDAHKQRSETELEKAMATHDTVLIQSKSQELKKVSQIIMDKKNSRQYARTIRIANEVHLAAAVLAVLYLFVFCPVSLQKALKAHARALHWFAARR